MKNERQKPSVGHSKRKLRRYVISASKPYEYLMGKSPKKGLPRGEIGFRPSKKRFSWKFRHGVVQYPYPLSEMSLGRYNLTPLSPHDPIVVDWAIGFVYDDAIQLIKRNEDYEAFLGGGKFATVENTGFSFSVTLTNSVGREIKKEKKFKDLRGACTYLWEHMDASAKRPYYEIVLAEKI